MRNTMINYRHDYIKVFCSKLVRNVFIATLLLIPSQKFCFAFANGIPGEYLTKGSWQNSFMSTSAMVNPALINEVDYRSLRFAALLGQDNPSNIYELGFLSPIGLYRSFGFNVIAEKGKKVQNWKYTQNGILADKSSKSSSNLITLSYCSNMLSKLSAGVNLHMLYQNNFDERTVGGIFDAGISYRFLLHPRFGYHVLGFTAKNLVAKQTSHGIQNDYPLQFNLQYHAELLGKMIKFDGRIGVSDLLASRKVFGEYGNQPEWSGAIQGSINILRVFNLKVFNEFNKSNVFGSTGFSIGMDVPTINNGRECSFAYQFINSPERGIGGTSAVMSRVDLGESREVMYAKRISKLISINELYSKAMKSFESANYVEAFFLLQQIRNNYPNYQNIDNVTFYAASSLEKMGMYEEAEKIFIQLKQNYKNSSLQRVTDLELMNIYSKRHHLSKANSQLEIISKHSSTDSVAQCAYYCMAQNYINNKEYSEAIPLLDKVLVTHPLYIFAQHSKAISLSNSRAASDKIIEAYQNCLLVVCNDDVSRDLMNRTMVMLGYISYNNNELEKSISAFQQIPEESYYYADALLGMSWAYLKNNQWNEAEIVSYELYRNASGELLKCEALLLQAYSKIMQKQYDKAQDLLKFASMKMSEIPQSTHQENFTKSDEMKTIQIDYSNLAKTAVDLSFKDNSVYSSLYNDIKNRQKLLKEVIDTHNSKSSHLRHQMVVEEDYEKIRDDIDFVIAKVAMMIKKKAYTKEIVQKDNRKRALNKEIERLKRELETLSN
jgi:tetratricopeptide (TPR) repeat protein